MTRIEVLQGVTYKTILKVMLKPVEADKVKADVIEYMSYRNGLPIEARNAVLIRVIMLKGSNFNTAYLRKTQESFEARGLTNAPAIIDYMDRIQDHDRKLGNNKRIEPSWMESYIKELKALEQPISR